MIEALLMASGVEWAVGRTLDKMSTSIVSRKDILSEIISVMSDTGVVFFFEKAYIELDCERFINIINEYISKENDIPLLHDMDKIFQRYLTTEQYHLLKPEWIEEYVFQCIVELSKKPNIASILLLFEIRAQEEERNSERIQREGLYHSILQDIKGNRKNDLYKDLEFLNSAIFPYISNILTEKCSDEMVDLAYFLADIYDYTSEYEKSIIISDRIRKTIMQKKTATISLHQLRQLIGCTYSYIIAKTKDSSERKELLKQAENDMQTIKEKYLDDWHWDCYANKYFIQSLYYSDYGALLINKSNQLSLKKNDRKEILKTALKYHKEAESLRRRIIEEEVYTDETGSRDDVERYYYKSKSNIANVLYQLCRFDEAIKIHMDVLEHSLSKGEIVNVMSTKAYIIGCYAGKIRNSCLLYEEKELCMKYIDECEGFYRERNDKNRLKDIYRKKKVIEGKSQKNIDN